MAHKGQKESPVRAIEMEISRGEHGSEMTMSAVPNITFNDVNIIPQLGFDYVDLFLIHWPLPTLYGGDFVSTWKTLEEFYRIGRNADTFAYLPH
jgi:hypothetical protein